MADVQQSLSTLAAHSLLVVGGGNMGSALLRGWLSSGLAPTAADVVEPADTSRLRALGIPQENIHHEMPADGAPAIVVLAVKPQIAASVCLELAPLLSPNSLVISILAGVARPRLSQLLGGHRRIIRAMPNTPAAIGAGSTVMVGGEGVSAADQAMANQLMACTGRTHWIDAEAQMDAVTALSGSGPAYVYHLIECLAAAGQHSGLPRALAQDLARETVIGAALLAQASTEAPEVLRSQVTSPGGTTEAGLDVLMGPDGLAPLIRHTVEAATRRSRELGK